MLRFLTVATLSFLTSGCLAIGLVGLVPTRGGGSTINQASNTTTTKPATTTPTTTTPTRSGDTTTPTTTTPSTLSLDDQNAQRLMGTWLAENPDLGLDRVTFNKFPPGTVNPKSNGGKAEAVFNGQRILGDFFVNGTLMTLQFPEENPAVHEFAFLNDGRLRIGQATYRKG